MDDERRINSVLAYQDKLLREFETPDMSVVEERISSSEKLLRELGYALPTDSSRSAPIPVTRIVRRPSFDELSAEAISVVGEIDDVRSLFSEDELRDNAIAVRRLNEEFDQIHRLDEIDVAISAAAGILAGIVDVFMIGVPKSTAEGLKAAPLSDYIRSWFESRYPPEEVERLERLAKVPYDAQDNRNTRIRVEGLSSYYHRLYSLGHDPILGFVVGTMDILNGKMTTIDRTGRVLSQDMPNYADRIETGIFEALAKQLDHLRSDMVTSMGLPAPLMGLCNLLQFGKIGEFEQTVAEIVRGMYYQGYDFIHFCSMSISTMLVEVFVRVCYAIKRIREGVPITSAIPITTNREKMPKLGTMLFVAHSAATAINTGKMCFGKDPVMAVGTAVTGLVIDPMAMNYVQWIAFAKYSYQQLRWCLITKPAMRSRYVLNSIDEELVEVYESVSVLFEEVERSGVVFLPNAF